MESSSAITTDLALLEQARIAAARYEYKQALEYIEQAAKMILSRDAHGTLNEEELNEAVSDLCTARLARARIRRVLGQWDEALSDYTWLRRHEKEAGLLTVVVQGYLGAADILAHRGENPVALELLEQASKVVEKTGDDTLVLQCNVQRASLFFRTGEFDRANTILTQCLGQLRPYIAQKRHLDIVASAQIQQGLALLRKGSLMEAAAIFEACLKATDKSPHESERAEAFRYLAITSSHQGQHVEALKKHLQALSLFKKTGNVFGQAKVFNSIGRTFLSMHQPNEAIYYMEKGREMCVQLKAEAELATIYGKLGDVYLSLQDTDRAVEYFRKDLELAEKFKNYYALGYSYRNLGRIFDQMGNTQESLKYLKESQDLFQYVEDQLHVGRVCTDLAHAYVLQGEVAEAEVMIDKADAIMRDHPEVSELPWLVALRGMAALRQGSTEQACALLERAIDGLVDRHHLTWRLEAMEEFGCALLAKGNRERALQKFREALAAAKEGGMVRNSRSLLKRLEDIDEKEPLRDWL